MTAMESNSNSFNYDSPLLRVVEIEPEGVLCNSPGNESVGENDGLW